MRIGADLGVGHHHALVDLAHEVLALLEQRFLLLGRLLDDGIEFLLLLDQVFFAGLERFLGLFDDLLLLGDQGFVLPDLLGGDLLLEILVFDLLADGLVLAVVLHVVTLRIVLGDQVLALFDGMLVLRIGLFDFLDLGLGIGDAGMESCNLVLQVLDLQRQFTAQEVDLVDLGVGLLDPVQRMEFLLHRDRIGVGHVLLQGNEGFPLVDRSDDLVYLLFCSHNLASNSVSGCCFLALPCKLQM